MRQQESGKAEGAAEAEEPDLGLGGVDPRQALGAVADFARQHPHAALGAAAGLGFLLGGGLSPRLLGGILMLAGRRYLSVSLRDTLTSVIQEQLAGAEEQGAAR